MENKFNEPVFRVKDSMRGKTVVVTNGKGRNIKHETFTLSSATSMPQIRKMVLAGVDISHFTGNQVGMEGLAAFVTTSERQRKSKERQPVRSKTVLLKASDRPATKDAAPVETISPLAGKKVLKLDLFEAGITSKVIDIVFKAKTEKDLESLSPADLKKVGTVLGLERVSFKAVLNKLK